VINMYRVIANKKEMGQTSSSARRMDIN
jgi:hypothetical protein